MSMTVVSTRLPSLVVGEHPLVVRVLVSREEIAGAGRDIDPVVSSTAIPNGWPGAGALAKTETSPNTGWPLPAARTPPLGPNAAIARTAAIAAVNPRCCRPVAPGPLPSPVVLSVADPWPVLPSRALTPSVSPVRRGDECIERIDRTEGEGKRKIAARSPAKEESCRRTLIHRFARVSTLKTLT